MSIIEALRDIRDRIATQMDDVEDDLYTGLKIDGGMTEAHADRLRAEWDKLNATFCSIDQVLANLTR